MDEILDGLANSDDQWMKEQKENLVLLKIDQVGQPSIQMLTEAGMIGKIGS